MPTLSGKENKTYTELLFPYAYNILGAAEDAKDAVQDVLVKYFSGLNKEIEDEKNYLIKAVVNTAINIKKGQKRRRPAGEPWLPEPIATDDAADKNLYLNDVLSYSLLVLMERLTAKERAVFILKETFDYPHKEIAGILNITEEYARQLFTRAKTSLFKPARKRTKEEATHEREVLQKFMSAIRQRDTQQLEKAMAADIRFYADSGGKVPLLATSSTGSANVAALIITAYNQFLSAATFECTVLNHQPALLSYLSGRLNACYVFDLHPETGVVLQINTVLDPDKLTALPQTPHTII